MDKLVRFSKLLAFLSLLVFVSKPYEAKAQTIEVGVTGGLSYYIGDIIPARHFYQSDFAFGASLRYYQNSRWAFRFQYSNINISASDIKSQVRPERGLAFSSKVNDFALMAEFNFLDYVTGSGKNKISPYIFGGVSFFTFKSVHPDGTALLHEQTTTNEQGETTTQLVGMEGKAYNSFSFSIPFGVGVKYSLCKRIGVTLEWRIHKTFTDYLDDIHGLYPEQDYIVDGYNYTDPTDNYEPGMQRGNGAAESILINSDWFSMFGLSVSYKFNLPKSKKCNAGMNSDYYRYY